MCQYRLWNKYFRLLNDLNPRCALLGSKDWSAVSFSRNCWSHMGQVYKGKIKQKNPCASIVCGTNIFADKTTLIHVVFCCDEKIGPPQVFVKTVEAMGRVYKGKRNKINPRIQMVVFTDENFSYSNYRVAFIRPCSLSQANFDDSGWTANIDLPSFLSRFVQ